MTNSIDTEYYFAYGSNMDAHKLKIKRKIDFYEKFSGKLDGWKLLFDKIASNKPGVAYSNIVSKENSSDLLDPPTANSLTTTMLIQGYLFATFLILVVISSLLLE